MEDQVKPGELLEHPIGQSAAKEDVEIFKKLDINQNYSVTNLEWCTNAENQKHAYKIGLRDSKSNSESARGVRNPNCKLSEQDVKDIKIKLVYLTGVELAKQYNVTTSTISNIKNNKKWKYLQSSTTIESYS